MRANTVAAPSSPSRWIRRFARPSAGRKVTIYLVLHGDTDPRNDSSFYLSNAGKVQSRAAAPKIWQRAGSNRIVVLRPQVGYSQVSYVETAKIIADELGAQVCDGRYWDVQGLLDLKTDFMTQLYRQVLEILERKAWGRFGRLRWWRSRDLYLVLTVGRKALEDYLADYQIPPMAPYGPDPRPGSVYEFVLTYNANTGVVMSRHLT